MARLQKSKNENEHRKTRSWLVPVSEELGTPAPDIFPELKTSKSDGTSCLANRFDRIDRLNDLQNDFGFFLKCLMH